MKRLLIFSLVLIVAIATMGAGFRTGSKFGAGLCPGFAPMQRGAVQTVTMEYEIPISTDSLAIFFDWSDYSTGIWLDHVSGTYSSQTVALNQPIVSADSVQFDTGRFLVFNTGSILANVKKVSLFARILCPSPTLAYNTICGVYDTGAYWVWQHRNGTSSQMSWFPNAGGYISDAGATIPGEWKTLAVVNAESEIRFYVNGSQIGSAKSSSSSAQTINRIAIGGQWINSINSAQYSLNSKMKYLAVYTEDKSDAEVASISADLEALP